MRNRNFLSVIRFMPRENENYEIELSGEIKGNEKCEFLLIFQTRENFSIEVLQKPLITINVPALFYNKFFGCVLADLNKT